MKRLKVWAGIKWQHLKPWVYSLLVSLGLITGTVIAASTTVSWKMPTERVDGTPLPLSELAETRLYCDGDPIAKHVEPAPGISAILILGFGTHVCDATVVDIFALESGRSNQITRVIIPTSPPKPVVLDP